MESHHDLPNICKPIYKPHHNIPMGDKGGTVWSKHYDDTLFEVEILKDKPDDDNQEFHKDMDQLLNSNKYLCHICNLDVPKSYAKEHNDSKKHKLCSEIAFIALGRVQKQTQLELFAPRKIDITDSYFCESCSKVILNSDKENHEKTKIHAISVKHDELLADLLKIYKDFEEVKLSETVEHQLVKNVIENEILNDVKALTKENKVSSRLEGDEEHKQEYKGGKRSIKEFFKVHHKELANRGIDVGKLKRGILEAAENQYKQPFLEKLQLTKNVFIRAQTQLELYDQKCQVLDSKINDYEDVKLDLKVRLTNLESQVDGSDVITLPCADNKTKRNINRAKARMLKKLQISKTNEQNCISCSTSTDAQINFDNPVPIKDKASDDKNVVNTYYRLSDETMSAIDALFDYVEIYTEEEENNQCEKDETDMQEKCTSLDDKNKEKHSKKEEVTKPVAEKSPTKIQRKEKQDPISASHKIHSIIQRYFNKNFVVDALKDIDVEQDKSEVKSDNKTKKVQSDKNLQVKHNSDTSSISKEKIDNNVDRNSNIFTLKDKNNIIKNKTDKKQTSSQGTQDVKNTGQNEIKKAENQVTQNPVHKKTAETINKAKDSATENKDPIPTDQKKKKKATREQTCQKHSPCHSELNTVEANKVSSPTKDKGTEEQKTEIDLANYLTVLKNKSKKPTHTVEPVTDNEVEITARNGDKFRVPLIHFHSLCCKGDLKTCMMCRCKSCSNSHVTNNDHMVNIMTPIKDCNGIRKIEDYLSHCVLCNTYIECTMHHIRAPYHKDNVKKTLVKLGPKSKKHIGDYEVINVDFKECESKNGALIELIEKNRFVMCDKNYLHCIVCDVIINKNVASVNRHIDLPTHLNKTEEKLAKNHIIKVREDNHYYCVPCDAQIDKTAVLSHWQCKKHTGKMQEFCKKINNNKEIKEPQDDVIVLPSISQKIKKIDKDKDTIIGSELICYVCNIIVFTIEDHLGTSEHKQCYKTYLQDNKLQELEADTYLCIPCNTEIGMRTLMCHCMSVKHKRGLETVKNATAPQVNTKNDTTVSNVTKPNKKVSNSATSSLTVPEKVSNPTISHPNQSGSSKTTSNAMSKSDVLMSPLLPKTISNSDPVSSKNVSMSKSAKLNADQPKEKANPALSTSVETKTLKPAISKKGYFVPDKISSPDTRPAMSKPLMPLKALFQFEESQTSTNMLCLVCDEEVAYNEKNTLQHIGTENHILAYNLMMVWNKIKKCDNNYFCDYCSENMTYFCELEHVFGKDHEEVLSKAPKTTVYAFDDTILTHDYAISHDVGNLIISYI